MADAHAQGTRTKGTGAKRLDEKLLASVVGGNGNNDGDGDDDDGSGGDGSAENANQRAQRVMQAVERTDALHMDYVWHGFVAGWKGKEEKARMAFPVDALPRVGWQALLKGMTASLFHFAPLHSPTIVLYYVTIYISLGLTMGWAVPAKREEAFLSGFVQTMVRQKSLPGEVLDWLFDRGKSIWLSYGVCWLWTVDP